MTAARGQPKAVSEAANIECLKAVIAGQQLKLSPTRSEFDEVHATERNLFYFACTRARDRLLVSGVIPASDFFEDFAAKRL